MRLIDADAFAETLRYYVQEAGWGDEVNKTLEWVINDFLPAERTIDDVPVIHCEDCQFFMENWKCTVWKHFVRPDGYCFRSERKPDEEETV